MSMGLQIGLFLAEFHIDMEPTVSFSSRHNGLRGYSIGFELITVNWNPHNEFEYDYDDILQFGVSS